VGSDDYVTKPFTKEDLLVVMARYDGSTA
jgi:DNA-binding response OmpR family regulator